MKFKVQSESHGKAVKRDILKIAKRSDEISVHDVGDLTGNPQPRSAKYCIWLYNDLKGKIRVRETKTGWYIYLPGSDEFVKKGLREKETPKKSANRRKKNRMCVVHRKKDGKTVEESCIYIDQYVSRIPDGNGSYIQQMLCLVQHVDGQLEEVKPKSVRIIVNEEDQCDGMCSCKNDR